MTDKPDYSTLNPVILAGDRCIENKNGPRMTIFTQDGEPTPYIEPSEAMKHEFLNAVTAASINMDIRHLIFMLGDLEEVFTQAAINALDVAHVLAHNKEVIAKGYDEETMCQGVSKYFDPDEVEQITPENSADKVLERFFPTSKPN